MSQSVDKTRIFLNVASGPYVLPGFINLDNSAFFQLARWWPITRWFLSGARRDIVYRFVTAANVARLERFNCKKPLQFDANSVDHILCSHFLEHLYSDEAMNVIRDFERVLKPGGTLHIILPDLEKQITRYLNSAEPDAADTLLQEMFSYGKKGRSLLHRVLDFNGAFGLNHLWMYDRRSISARVTNAGLVVSDDISNPSHEFRADDGSLHVTAFKP